ncbi:hypothetical protein LUZ62_042771 [Rhynchospora pubera]|uniref:Uncharacterized protein n=1 Tax=Rhynchospora pubera TaxID=906938 RepID=A0AAV8FDB1_9POAL|nr:hypothetical protein LUZ62_042771 [Rhynchospora pubera]
MSSVTEPCPHKAEAQKKQAVPGRTSLRTARRSLHPQFEQARKEKPKAVLPAQAPRGVASTKFQDNANAHRVVKRNSVPPIPLKGSKPWPGSGAKTADNTDELIKHMSNVPSYLQRATHNGDNIQGKALNVGVLEWNTLERYTTKKHLAYGTTKVAFPSSSNGTATPTNKKQSANPPVDSDPEYSSSVLHYRRSFSQRKSKGTPNEEEMYGERGRAGTKCFTSNGSPLQGGQIKRIPSRFSGELSVDPQINYHHTRVPFSCELHREDSNIGAIATTTTTAVSGSSTSTGSNGNSLHRENAKAVSRGLTILNRNELSLSCTLKEQSSDSGPPLVNSRGKMSNVESTEREAASSKRGRQSPLRRMLDPLLKPKNAASASVSASHHESTPVGLRRLMDSRIGLSNRKKEHLTGTGTCAENSAIFTTPSFQPSTRQALLQLAWKAGLPVFMLSSGESDILGATLRRKCTSDTADNPEISYSIFTLQESKTKGGSTWIRPGNKGEKQHLVSNIVGEVRVSTCKSKCRNNSDLYHVSREFVLVGPQLVPNAKTERAISDTEKDSPVNHELAAIVTNLPTSSCLCGKTDSVGSMTAILPSGIHGSSTQGEPSSLIERWWSGGGCDCGGWDEGCRLSLLSLEFSKESKSNWEDSLARFELFPQGHSKGGHAFSMICFKEGLYTVEIKSSIPLLQAFAICISLLHCRSPLKHGTQQEETLEVRNGGPPTSYMQCHPPLSPVGRA